MLTDASKVFLPISAVAVAVGVLYVAATGDEAGLTLMLTLSTVAAFAGVVVTGARQNEVAPVVAPDAPPPQWREVQPPRPAQGAIWPILGAIACGLVVVGLIAPTIVAVAGIVLAGAAVVGWMASVASDRTGRSPNLLPLGIPMVGLFTIFALMFFMSRILLAVPEAASTTIALVVAILILAGASFVAVRPSLSTKALIVVLAVTGVALTAGGVVAALVGQREVHHAGGAHGAVDVTAKNIAFLEKEIHLTAETRAEIHFENDDPAPHNVAIYTSPDLARDIFIGRIIVGPDTSVDYEFTAPPAGEYYFRCDVHPNMQGKVEVAP